MPKTYKREIATFMLLVFYGFCVASLWGASQSLEVVKILSVPTHAAVAVAFGLDAYAKQIGK